MTRKPWVHEKPRTPHRLERQDLEHTEPPDRAENQRQGLVAKSTTPPKNHGQKQKKYQGGYGQAREPKHTFPRETKWIQSKIIPTVPPSSARFPQRRNDIHRSTQKKHQIHPSIEWAACQSPSPAPFPHPQTANTRVTRLNRPFYLELRRSERLRGYMDCLQAKQTIKSKPPARASLSSLSTRTLNTGGAVVKMTGGATRPLQSPLHSARRPPPDTFFFFFFFTNFISPPCCCSASKRRTKTSRTTLCGGGGAAVPVAIVLAAPPHPPLPLPPPRRRYCPMRRSLTLRTTMCGGDASRRRRRRCPRRLRAEAETACSPGGSSPP